MKNNSSLLVIAIILMLLIAVIPTSSAEVNDSLQHKTPGKPNNTGPGGNSSSGNGNHNYDMVLSVHGPYAGDIGEPIHFRADGPTGPIIVETPWGETPLYNLGTGNPTCVCYGWDFGDGVKVAGCGGGYGMIDKDGKYKFIDLPGVIGLRSNGRDDPDSPDAATIVDAKDEITHVYDSSGVYEVTVYYGPLSDVWSTLGMSSGNTSGFPGGENAYSDKFFFNPKYIKIDSTQVYIDAMPPSTYFAPLNTEKKYFSIHTSTNNSFVYLDADPNKYYYNYGPTPGDYSEGERVYGYWKDYPTYSEKTINEKYTFVRPCRLVEEPTQPITNDGGYIAFHGVEHGWHKVTVINEEKTSHYWINDIEHVGSGIIYRSSFNLPEILGPNLAMFDLKVKVNDDDWSDYPLSASIGDTILIRVSIKNPYNKTENDFLNDKLKYHMEGYVFLDILEAPNLMFTSLPDGATLMNEGKVFRIHVDLDPAESMNVTFSAKVIGDEGGTVCLASSAVDIGSRTSQKGVLSIGTYFNDIIYINGGYDVPEVDQPPVLIITSPKSDGEFSEILSIKGSVLDPDGGVLNDVKVGFARRNGKIEGKVLNINDPTEGMPGIPITIEPGNISITTDTEGNYSLRLQPGKYNLKVGIGPRSQTVSVMVNSGVTSVQNFSVPQNHPPARPIISCNGVTGGNYPPSSWTSPPPCIERKPTFSSTGATDWQYDGGTPDSCGTLTFQASTTDPDGDAIVAYEFDFGDGTHFLTNTSIQAYPFPMQDLIGVWFSGPTGGAGAVDAFEVRVRAKDSYGTWSSWSEPLIIGQMVKATTSLFDLVNNLISYYEKEHPGECWQYGDIWNIWWERYCKLYGDLYGHVYKAPEEKDDNGCNGGCCHGKERHHISDTDMPSVGQKISRYLIDKYLADEYGYGDPIWVSVDKSEKHWECTFNSEQLKNGQYLIDTEASNGKISSYNSILITVANEDTNDWADNNQSGENNDSNINPDTPPNDNESNNNTLPPENDIPDENGENNSNTTPDNPPDDNQAGSDDKCRIKGIIHILLERLAYNEILKKILTKLRLI